MTRRSRRILVPCDVCETLTRLKYPRTGPQLCITHAGQRVMDAADQMRNRSGPHYEKWVQAVKRYAGLPTPPPRG